MKNIILKERLINDICTNCDSKKYTVGFKNNLRCGGYCDVINIIQTQPTIKITNSNFTSLVKNKKVK